MDRLARSLCVGLVAGCGPDVGEMPVAHGGTGTGLASTSGGECERVHHGDLRIDDTTDLTALHDLRAVEGGDVLITGIATHDLSFLGCLTEVRGDFGIGVGT